MKASIVAVIYLSTKYCVISLMNGESELGALANISDGLRCHLLEYFAINSIEIRRPP